MIPSADREGRPRDACLYGSKYSELEDAITQLLVEGGEPARETEAKCTKGPAADRAQPIYLGLQSASAGRIVIAPARAFGSPPSTDTV